MTPYIIAPAAKLDLVEIRDYLARRGGRSIAARVLRELRQAMVRIADRPGLGHAREDLAHESLRFYRVYKYLIVYRNKTTPIGIVRILHGARDVSQILGSSN